MKTLFSSLVFVLLIISSYQINPAIKGRLTKHGLNYANGVAIDVLMTEIKRLKIPDINQKAGSADVNMKNIKIEKLSRPSGNLTIITGNGIRWTGSNLDPYITSEYSYTHPLGFMTIRKRGKVMIQGENLGFTVDLHIDIDSIGKPIIKPTKCHSSGHIDISFEGEWSDILNVGLTLFKTQISNLIKKEVCVAVQAELGKTSNELFRQVNVKEPIADGVVFDHRMIRKPTFTTYVSTYHKGAIYYDPSPSLPKTEPSLIPELPEFDSKMIYGFFTEYVVNSGLKTGFERGRFQVHLSGNQIPASMKQYLRTSCPVGGCIGTVFPSTRSYSELSLRFSAVSQPKITFEGGKIFATASIKTDILGVKQAKLDTLVSIIINVYAEIKIYLENNRVKFKINPIRHSFEIKSTGALHNSSPFIERMLIGSLIDALINDVLKQMVNVVGSQGYAVPDLHGVSFKNATIEHTPNLKHVLVIGSDINYTHSPLNFN